MSHNSSIQMYIVSSPNWATSFMNRFLILEKFKKYLRVTFVSCSISFLTVLFRVYIGFRKIAIDGGICRKIKNEKMNNFNPCLVVFFVQLLILLGARVEA